MLFHGNKGTSATIAKGQVNKDNIQREKQQSGNKDTQKITSHFDARVLS